MPRRILQIVLLLLAVAMAPRRADAVTIRDVIELSKAGLSDTVLVALIEVDRSVFNIDNATLKLLKNSGVSDAVIVALIRSGRMPPPAEPAPEPRPEPKPEVVVIDHHDTPPPAPAPVMYPVAVPVYVPVATAGFSRGFTTRDPDRIIETTFPTDIGLVKARLPVPPNCVKAQPVFWGFGGQLRPGSWEPPPTIVCR